MKKVWILVVVFMVFGLLGVVIYGVILIFKSVNYEVFSYVV